MTVGTVESSAYLAGLIEPSDEVMGWLVAHLGHVRAYEWVRDAFATGRRVDESARDEIQKNGEISAARLARGVQRWNVRAARIDSDRILRQTELLQAEILTCEDPRWPSHLNDLGLRKPVCIWVRGDVKALELRPRRVAIVGARNCTAYGENICAQLTRHAVDHDIAVISGGAYGIDAVAHRTALNEGGTTYAVLAGGIDRLYPSGNARLLEHMVESGGLLISESVPGALPMKSRFLSRNRLIAALSDGVVVVEAAWRSGTLSTAHHALEIGRPVGVVPGPITSSASAGCHRLLQETPAQVIARYEDLPVLVGTAQPPCELETYKDSQEATRILDGLRLGSDTPLEQVAVHCGIEAREALGILARLEVLGVVVRAGGGWRKS